MKKKRKTGSECGCKQRRIATFTNTFAEYFHYTTVWRIYCQILSFVLFTFIYFRLLVSYLLRLQAASEPNEYMHAFTLILKYILKDFKTFTIITALLYMYYLSFTFNKVVF